MAHLYRAAWVVPIAAPPIRRGWVAVDRGRIVSVGPPGSNPPSGIVETIDLGAAALLPGLVNAHTHLELSWMRNQVPPAASMPAWAARLMALRRTVSTEPPAPILEAVREVRAAGTSLVGDVTQHPRGLRTAGRQRPGRCALSRVARVQRAGARRSRRVRAGRARRADAHRVAAAVDRAARPVFRVSGAVSRDRRRVGRSSR